jgi:hypothetical protein
MNPDPSIRQMVWRHVPGQVATADVGSSRSPPLD